MSVTQSPQGAGPAPPGLNRQVWGGSRDVPLAGTTLRDPLYQTKPAQGRVGGCGEQEGRTSRGRSARMGAGEREEPPRLVLPGPWGPVPASSTRKPLSPASCAHSPGQAPRPRGLALGPLPVFVYTACVCLRRLPSSSQQRPCSTAPLTGGQTEAQEGGDPQCPLGQGVAAACRTPVPSLLPKPLLPDPSRCKLRNSVSSQVPSPWEYAPNPQCPLVWPRPACPCAPPPPSPPPQPPGSQASPLRLHGAAPWEGGGQAAVRSLGRS